MHRPFVISRYDTHRTAVAVDQDSGSASTKHVTTSSHSHAECPHEILFWLRMTLCTSKMYGSVENSFEKQDEGQRGALSGAKERAPIPSFPGRMNVINNSRFYIATSLAVILAAISVCISMGQGKVSSVPSLQANLGAAKTDPTSISKRGQSLTAVRDDIPLFLKGKEDPYHPIENPDGYLVMLVAENKLMWKEMAAKIEQVQAAEPLPAWIFNYGDMGGDDAFKQSMATMMQHWILGPIDKDYLRFQDGAGSVLDQISYILTDPGDGVLTTVPGYPAFASDFGVYASAKLHYVDSDTESGYVPTRKQLDEALERSTAAGNPPRIYVICQPHNPTGTVYSKDDMEMMVNWALDKGLHVVSDEIYALSTFPGYDTPSAADVMWEKHPDQEQFLGDRVHIVAGLSKDWGMSGFRVGSLFSHNEALLTALDTIGYYQTVSQYTQNALTKVFEDEEFVSWYIEENQRRLYETYVALHGALDRISVPLVPSQGAIFAWADFSAYIQDGQTEKDLWMELFNDTKVALTSGQSCMANKPGMFRIVYGWPEGGPIAMKEFGDRLVVWKQAREAASGGNKTTEFKNQ